MLRTYTFTRPSELEPCTSGVTVCTKVPLEYAARTWVFPIEEVHRKMIVDRLGLAAAFGRHVGSRSQQVALVTVRRPTRF